MFTRCLRAVLGVFAPLALLFAFATLSFGQATDGVIVGTVADAAGAAVIGATVTATNKDTGVKHTEPTNEAGEYRMNNVPAGRYDVMATAKGFATATLANLEVN